MNLVATATPAPEHHRYRLLAPIARGGMAELHLAATDGADECTKIVAVKRVWPELAHERDFVTMFTDEARLAVRLNHPNVVQTFEVGRMGGRLFIAMEFLEGQTLNAILSRLRAPDLLSLPLRLKILSNVLSGLHYAHELTAYDGTPLGVVHRDVSPQNVFVTYDGSVKLLDFGIAKTLAAAHQTLPGVMKGRVAYMAPESVRGDMVDRRSDIFSVGIMLWETACHRRFWQGETETSILRKLISGTPIEVPPLPSDAPAGLEEVCRRALSIDRDDRQATAAEMQAEIERLIVGSSESYDRQLGSVVSYAFRQEQQQMRALIDRRLRGESLPGDMEANGRPTTRSFTAVPIPPPEAVPMATFAELAPAPWWTTRKAIVVAATMALLLFATLAGAKTLIARQPVTKFAEQVHSPQAPAAVEQAPAAVEQAPAAVEQAPAAVGHAPAAVEQAPPKFAESVTADGAGENEAGKPSSSQIRVRRHVTPSRRITRKPAAAPLGEINAAPPSKPSQTSLDVAAEDPPADDPFDHPLPPRPSRPSSSRLDVNNPYR